MPEPAEDALPGATPAAPANDASASLRPALDEFDDAALPPTVNTTAELRQSASKADPIGALNLPEGVEQSVREIFATVTGQRPA